MATMNISLPEELKSFVQKKTKRGGYSTPSDYIRSLIRADLITGRPELEELLLAGLDSDFELDTPKAREAFRKELQQLAKQRKAKKTATK